MYINVQEVYSACASELDYSGFEAHIIGKLTDFQSEYHASEMCATLADVETQKKVFRAVGTPQPTRALCLGLGTFSRSKGGVETSSVQLYAFKAMLKGFDIPESKAIIHDPAFTDSDRSFIKSFGMFTQADPETALQELICEEPTLILHPCLPWPVLEIVLKQNWSPSLLKNVTFVGYNLDGWVNDHYIKRVYAQKPLSDYVTEYYTPRLDRCIPLFDTEALTKRDYVNRKGMECPDDDTQVSSSASFFTEFCFQWIPTYRVFATGEQFWKILKLEDSAWKHLVEPEEEEGPIKSKL